MYALDEVRAVDPEIVDLILAELNRQNSHIELIAETIAGMLKNPEGFAEQEKTNIKTLTDRYPLI